MKKPLLVMAAALGLQAAGGAGAGAQVYPTHPVTMVVPLAAGGPVDTVGRILAERMRVSLGQPVIVENVTGAGGTIGTARLVRAAPDGYTIGMGFLGTHVLNGALYTLNYDLVNDFDPIALASSNPHVIVGRLGLPAANLRELIAWLKLNPGKAAAAHAGNGTSTHVAALLFEKVAGVQFQVVPYRGAAPALQDVVAGQVDLMVDVTSNSLPYLLAGKIKGYAITAPMRLPSAPDIPTVDEAGLPGFYMTTWYALFGPRGLPPEVLARLNAAATDALADPGVRSRFAAVGLEVPPLAQQTPDALRALQRAEIEKWWPILKDAGVKAE